MKLTQSDFEMLLQEQLEFIRASARAYDAGFEGEAKRLALAVRVLVHDTANARSLLRHLGRKGIMFVDTARPFDPTNELTHSSLTMLAMGTPSGNVPLPPLDGSLTKREVDFDTWWDGVVFVDKDRNEFSRRDIVLTLANKEGGAHVDHALDQRYADLRRNNALAWYDVSPDGKATPGTDEVPATMRQMAHEMLRTLDPSSPPLKQRVTAGVIVHASGFYSNAALPPPLPEHNPLKRQGWTRPAGLGRNDPCPCGSGKKYKKCHGTSA